MTLLRLIYRSLRQHALSTLVTATSIALAAGLLMTVWITRQQAQDAFTSATGFDAVLGARGSKLQLVLNALFHLEASPGNLPAADYEQIRRHPAVKAAVPIALGDNYRGWRIVGTIPELFTAVEYAAGKKHAMAAGKVFAPGTRDAIIGSFAAEQLGFKVGATFQPYHGLNFDPGNQHEEVFTVSGILAPTNTPADRVIWISLSGVQTMSGHDPSAANDVSAVLLQFKSPVMGFPLDTLYNKQGNRLTLAYPAAAIVADFFAKISWFDRILALVAYLIALVAAASVLASIYASMSTRRRDIAILRALGARRRMIFGAIVLEAAAIGLLGALGGFVIYFGLGWATAEVLRQQCGVVISLAAYHPVLWAAPLGLVGLAALAGVVPAWRAYRTPVAENLTPIA